MSGINRVILIGRLGQDPEIKPLQNGRPRASFSMATTDRWADKTNGERKEHTQWHRIVTWGKTAELVEKYLSKGRQVCVEGSIQTRSWTDKEGKKQFITEVVASSITFLGDKKKEVSVIEVAA